MSAELNRTPAIRKEFRAASPLQLMPRCRAQRSRSSVCGDSLLTGPDSTLRAISVETLVNKSNTSNCNSEFGNLSKAPDLEFEYGATPASYSGTDSRTDNKAA
jgi:hypothetical protein